jgi:hypothetical protein
MKKINYLFFIITITLSLISSCTRNEKDNFGNSINPFLIQYLHVQKIENPISASFIDTLIKNSDWVNVSQLYVTSSVKLIYLPLKYHLNNTGIVFLYNLNTRQVFYSHIAEIQLNYTTANTISNIFKNRAIDVLGNFYRYVNHDFTGSIRAYSLNNNFLWEFGFKNGVKKFEKTITKQSKRASKNIDTQIISNSVASSNIKEESCFDWYLVTWYDDGTSDWRFIGTTCYNDCLETIGITIDSTRIKTDCSGDRGGGGGSGETNNTITNNVKEPCLKKLISNLQNSNKINNSIGGILQSIFGVNDYVNLTFEENNDLKNSNGQTLNGQATSLGNGNFGVTLNANALSPYSQERKTLTIMHEVLHDYFFYKYNNPSQNGHTRMVTSYIDKMANSLEDLYPAMKAHHDVTIALCLDNLSSSVGNGANQIDPSIFNRVVLESGLSLGGWKGLADQAKYSYSNLATKAPCGGKGN